MSGGPRRDRGWGANHLVWVLGAPKGRSNVVHPGRGGTGADDPEKPPKGDDTALARAPPRRGSIWCLTTAFEEI
jgi:hypothetical protein